MSPPVYRFDRAQSPTAMPMRDGAEARVFEAPRFTGTLCRDMYGDLPLGLLRLSDATIRGSSGYIFLGDTPILEQNADFLRNKKFLRPRFHEISAPSAPTLEVEELITLKSRCHHYFWHWLMDSLPKVFLAEESGFKGSYLIPSPSEAPWAAESLRLVGIQEARIALAECRDVHAQKLFVPTYFCGYNAIHNPDFTRSAREWIRAAIQSSPRTRSSRIFVGRRELGKARNIREQASLERLLAEFGFTTVYFEDHSLGEQISIASGAEVLIGGHGSGLTHSLFMDEGSLVVELFPFKRRQTNDCYEMLSSVIRHRYFGVETPTDRGSDIEVDQAALRELLAREI